MGLITTIGIANSLVGSFFTAAGYACQRTAHLRVQQKIKEREERKSEELAMLYGHFQSNAASDGPQGYAEERPVLSPAAAEAIGRNIQQRGGDKVLHRKRSHTRRAELQSQYIKTSKHRKTSNNEEEEGRQEGEGEGEEEYVAGHVQLVDRQESGLNSEGNQSNNDEEDRGRRSSGSQIEGEDCTSKKTSKLGLSPLKIFPAKLPKFGHHERHRKSDHLTEELITKEKARTGELDSSSSVSPERRTSIKPDADKEPEREFTVAKEPIFYLGILFLVLGTFSSLANFGLLGQAVQAPFAALTLIYNAFIAGVVLKEPVSKYDVVSSTFIVGGVAIALSYTEDVKTTFTLHQLIDRFFMSSPWPLIYTGVTVGSMIFLKAAVIARSAYRQPLGLFAFSFLAGQMAGFTGVIIKCNLDIWEAQVKELSSDKDYQNFGTYLLLLAVPAVLLTQLYFMNQGLKFFDALKFVPLYHSFIIFSNIICGIVYFDELRHYGTTHIIVFLTGSFVTVIGVCILLIKALRPGAIFRERSGSSLTESLQEKKAEKPKAITDGYLSSLWGSGSKNKKSKYDMASSSEWDLSVLRQALLAQENGEALQDKQDETRLPL